MTKKRAATSSDSDNNLQHQRLQDALDEVEQMSDTEVDIVLLPPENVDDGDTDTEMGNDNETRATLPSELVEVCGHLEVQTSRKATKSAKKSKRNGKQNKNTKAGEKQAK